MVRLAVVAVVLGLAACGGGGGGRKPSRSQFQPRPEGPPDVVLISVSGRCGDLLCAPPEDNVAYLGDPGDAAEAIAAAFEGAGRSVARGDYIAALNDYDDDRDGQSDRFGFLSLVEDLEWIRANWIDGAAAPARIVIVAHSHGCVWAHIACSVLPQVPVEYLISLDANCLTWETSYGPEVADWLRVNGNPWAWDISDPCDRWTIPGLADPADTEDVAFDNVGINLEVRSNDSLFLQDMQANHRLDGGVTGILTYDALADGHGDVHDPAGESMPWVLGQLALLGY